MYPLAPILFAKRSAKRSRAQDFIDDAIEIHIAEFHFVAGEMIGDVTQEKQHGQSHGGQDHLPVQIDPAFHHSKQRDDQNHCGGGIHSGVEGRKK